MLSIQHLVEILIKSGQIIHLVLLKQRPEWEIVGAFAADPVNISSIISGDGFTPSSSYYCYNHNRSRTYNWILLSRSKGAKCMIITYLDHSSQAVSSNSVYLCQLPFVRANLPASPSASGATVTIETDTVSGASPYIFNISLRSVYGMQGMHADGS